MKKYSLTVTNKDELKKLLKSKYDVLSDKYINDIVNTIVDNVSIDLEESKEDNETAIEDNINIEDNTNNTGNNESFNNNVTNNNVTNNIDVLKFINTQNMKLFKDNMLASLFDHISRNGFNILYGDLLVSYRYRASMIYHNKLYDVAIKDSKYITEDKILLGLFFMDGIKSNKSYHRFRNKETIQILRANGSNINALLDESTYNKVLDVGIKAWLLCGIPSNYILTEQDKERIKKFYTDILYNRISLI